MSSTQPRQEPKEAKSTKNLSWQHPKKHLTAKFRSRQRKQSIETNESADHDPNPTNSASINSLLDAASTLTALACEPQRLEGQHATSLNLENRPDAARTNNTKSEVRGELVMTTASQATAAGPSLSSNPPRKRSQEGNGKGHRKQRSSKRSKALPGTSDEIPAASCLKQSPEEKPANPGSSPAKEPSDLHGLTAKEKIPIPPKQRYIPAHKKSSCALTFPEKLLAMLDYADKMKAELAAKGQDPETFCLSWRPDGESFLVRDPVACTQTIIPLFFKKAKFASITRKLYRWGFHQVERRDAEGPPLPPDAMIFANEHFKRDARHEIVNMRSNTTPSYRRISPKDNESEDDERANLPVVTFQLTGQYGNVISTSADGTSNTGKARYDGTATTSSEAASSERSHCARTSTSSSLNTQEQHQSSNPAMILHQLQQQLQNQNQRQQQIQAVLTAYNGDLSRVDPKVLQILRSEANNGRPHNSDSSVATLLVGNDTPNPCPNLQRFLPNLSNNNINPGHQQQQIQYQRQRNQQLLWQSLGLTASHPFANNGTSTTNHSHRESDSVPQQGAFEGGTITPFLIQSFMNGNPSAPSSNDVSAQLQSHETAPPINIGVNILLQNAGFPHGTNGLLPSSQSQHQASPLFRQHRQPSLPQDTINTRQVLNTFTAPFVSHRQGSRPPAPSSSQDVSEITQLQNLTQLQKEHLVRLLRNAAETLENGGGREGQL